MIAGLQTYGKDGVKTGPPRPKIATLPRAGIGRASSGLAASPLGGRGCGVRPGRAGRARGGKDLLSSSCCAAGSLGLSRPSGSLEPACGPSRGDGGVPQLTPVAGQILHDVDHARRQGRLDSVGHAATVERLDRPTSPWRSKHRSYCRPGRGRRPHSCFCLRGGGPACLHPCRRSRARPRGTHRPPGAILP